MKSRRRTLLLVAALVPLAAAAWLGLNHYRSRRALEAYKRQLIATGEKLTIAELIPKPPPAERDGTFLFSKAALILSAARGALNTNNPPAMRMVAPGRAMIGWQQPDLRDGDATNSWADVRAQLDACAEAFELLHALRERPEIDGQLDYRDGFRMRIPSLVERKTAVQRLGAAAVCHLREGDASTAVTHLRTLLLLARSSTDERLLISQLVRFAMVGIAMAPTWEVLQSSQVTEAQLAVVQRDWEEMEFIGSMGHALEMERAMILVMAEEMRQSAQVFEQASAWWSAFGGGGGSGGDDSLSGQAMEFAKASWAKSKERAKYLAWRFAWANADELTALQAIQATLVALRRVEANGVFGPALQGQQRELARLGLADNARSDGGDFLGLKDAATRHVLAEGVSPLHNSMKRVLPMEVGRQLVATAIALKRFQLRHGRLPADLSALTPAFLHAVPRDPVDGQPLRYRRHDDGSFVLYSIGEDGVDDGGNPRSPDEKPTARYWRMGRDWVWPQPASAAEVEAYYATLRQQNTPTIRYGLPPHPPVTTDTNSAPTPNTSP